MNWDAIGAIAEMLAALGVITSLIFVGLQVRKSTTESRAATRQATTDTEIAMVTTFAAHAEVWQKVNQGEALESGTETRLGILLFALLMVDYENRYHQYLAGNFDERTWKSRTVMLRDTVNLPIYDHWRHSLGGRSRSADFLDLLDAIADDVRSKP